MRDLNSSVVSAATTVESGGKLLQSGKVWGKKKEKNTLKHQCLTSSLYTCIVNHVMF